MPRTASNRADTGERAAERPVGVGYCRRSTDRQEQSILDQERAIERYCAERGITLLRWYIDDAVSGTSTAGRKGFLGLMADAQKKKCPFRYVLCYDIKRFGRVDNDEAGHYRYVLRQHGIEVLYVTENFTGDRSDDLLRSVKQWQAREESADLARVSIRGLLTKCGTGCWMGGVPPFGYDLRYESHTGAFLLRLRYNRDGTKQVLDDNAHLVRNLERGETIAVSKRDRCRLVPGDPGRVAAVQRIYELCAHEGCGSRRIAETLNDEGVAPARGPQWSAHHSGRWSSTAVRSVLAHPAYCGDMVWNRRTDARFFMIADGGPVPRPQLDRRRLTPNDRATWITVRAAHEPLVSRRLWEAAQQRLAAAPGAGPQRLAAVKGHSAPLHPVRPPPARGPRSRFLLSALCTCSRCGSRYEGHAVPRSRPGGAPPDRFVYMCGGFARRGPSVCGAGAVDQVRLERAVLAVVSQYYKRYTGPNGEDALHAAVSEAVGRSALAPGEAIDLNRAVREIAGVLASIPSAPVDANHRERAAALRRCVHSIQVDAKKNSAMVCMIPLPLCPGLFDAMAPEPIMVRLGPKASRAASEARSRTRTWP